MKKLMALVLIVVLAAMGYFSYTKYQETVLMNALRPMVNDATIRVSCAIETRKGNISFGELIDKLQGDITEIEKNVFALKKMRTSSNKDRVEVAIVYVSGSQDFLRGHLFSSRKRMSSKASIKAAERYLDETKGSSRFSSDTASQMIKEAELDSEEYISSLKSLKLSSRKMIDLVESASSVFDDDILVDKALLNGFIDSFSSDKPKNEED